eukprot:gnl/TRDRNA2_/TRDRNA2_128171_c0_seq1.p1 gnl/TRDRNA2_/TRDRNA2_128171_c0~~gnl/TRDRNA2_/TRDRNA2_128171_c0_seq1.p1  ORF type:complete len:219 (-),score=25.19 gnl/TRDRNA2_/TRDRNA2_128171_c0_seq1:63-719(-)
MLQTLRGSVQGGSVDDEHDDNQEAGHKKRHHRKKKHSRAQHSLQVPDFSYAIRRSKETLTDLGLKIDVLKRKPQLAHNEIANLDESAFMPFQKNIMETMSELMETLQELVKKRDALLEIAFQRIDSQRTGAVNNARVEPTGRLDSPSTPTSSSRSAQVTSRQPSRWHNSTRTESTGGVSFRSTSASPAPGTRGPYCRESKDCDSDQCCKYGRCSYLCH